MLIFNTIKNTYGYYQDSIEIKDIITSLEEIEDILKTLIKEGKRLPNYHLILQNRIKELTQIIGEENGSRE